MSIKTKITLIIAIVFSVVGLLAGFFIYWQSSRVLSAHINTDIIATANQTSQLVNFYLGRAESNLANLAIDPLLIDALETGDDSKLALVSNKLTPVKIVIDVLENISLVKINGSSCIIVASDQAAQSLVGHDFSERDYCQGIIKTRSSYISSAYISLVSNKPVLGVASPIINSKGQLVGFVYGALDLEELRGYLWDLQQGQDSKIELLDRYGVMFLNTQEEIKTLGGLSEEEESELSEIKAGIAGGQPEGHIKDEDNFVSYKSDGPFTIIYEKSAANLLTLIRSLNLTIVVSLLIAIILAIVIVLFSIGRITNRISRLSKFTQEIIDGNFNIKLNQDDLTAKDETAILARGFNEMTGKLKDLYETLDKKVKDRTKQLEQSESKLKKTLAESEKINQLMVGRELDMIKLKKQLAEAQKNNLH